MTLQQTIDDRLSVVNASKLRELLSENLTALSLKHDKTTDDIWKELSRSIVLNYDYIIDDVNDPDRLEGVAEDLNYGLGLIHTHIRYLDTLPIDTVVDCLYLSDCIYETEDWHRLLEENLAMIIHDVDKITKLNGKHIKDLSTAMYEQVFSACYYFIRELHT